MTNIDINSAPPTGAFAKLLEELKIINPGLAVREEADARRWLTVECPSCGAEPGQWCEKKRHVEEGGASHLTRVDRAVRLLERS